MMIGGPVEVAEGVTVAVSPMAALPPVKTGPGGLPPWRTREYGAARLLLRGLLTRVIGADASRTPIAARRTGQPYLPRWPKVTVSLSHSGEWVAAAVGVDRSVGVDVQVPQPVPDTLLRRCCSPATRRALHGLPDPRRDLEFAWLWSAQEACVKAIGRGLAGQPWTVPVRVEQRAGTWHGVSWQALREHCAIPLSCAYQGVSR